MTNKIWILKSRFAFDIDQVPMQMQMEKISLRNNENKNPFTEGNTKTCLRAYLKTFNAFKTFPRKKHQQFLALAFKNKLFWSWTS